MIVASRTAGDAVSTISTRRAASRTTTRIGLRSDQAYLQLKEALINGDYVAGERLSIETIALSIGSSRQPVMDAVRRLESEGLLNVVPQVGTIVPVIDGDQLLDFFEYHARTEAFFCELAAARRTDAEAEDLIAIVDGFPRTRRETKDAKAIAREYRLHNREFHSLIHHMARSPLLHQTAVAMWDRSDLYLNTFMYAKPFADRAAEAVKEHRMIAGAILAKDRVAVRNAAIPHILTFAHSLTTPVNAGLR